MNKRRLCALFLAAALLCGAIPMQVIADAEKQPVIARELGELTVPTEFPEKGVLSAKIARSKGIDDSGCAYYEYEEFYIPVVVSSDERVYGQLDALAGKMGLDVSYYGMSVSLQRAECSFYLAAGDRTAGFGSPLYNAMINLRSAPLILDQKWYVPLDEFFYLTGTLQIYGEEENWLGKKELLLVPQERTVLDDIAAFKKQLYSKYAFNFTKDLGYSIDTTAKLSAEASVSQLVYKLGSMDWYAWMLLAFGTHDVRGIDLYENRYVDTFMTKLLTESEEVTSELLLDAKKTLDQVGVMMNITGKELSYMLSLQAKNKLLPVLVSQGKGGLADPYFRYLNLTKDMEAARSVMRGVGYGCALASTAMVFTDSDAWCAEAAEKFYAVLSTMEQPVITKIQSLEVKEKIEQFNSQVEKSAGDEFAKKYGPSLLNDALAMANLGNFRVAKFYSSLWKGGVDLVMGEWLDSAESMKAGLFGMQYEADAMLAAEETLQSYLTGGKTAKSLSDEEKKNLQQLYYHAAKACLVTRAFGCEGAKQLLDDHPDIRKWQQDINRELTKLTARLRNTQIPFGRLPGDWALGCTLYEDHVPNVIYNLCSLEGQIIDREKEIPAEHVRIEVMSDSGEKLAEFQTDENGWFEQEFALEEVDTWEDTPAVQELTLHLFYKKHPVILEDIQVNYFHAYELEGLLVGRETQESLVYVTGASRQNGQNVMTILRIDLDEDVWVMDAPDYQGGTYELYAAMPGQMHTAADEVSVVLEDGMEFETYFSQIMPEGSLIRGIADLGDLLGANLAESEELVPDALLKAPLAEAEDIDAFVKAYQEYTGQYPTFRLKTVNSLAVSAEPVMVVAEE